MFSIVPNKNSFQMIKYLSTFVYFCDTVNTFLKMLQILHIVLENIVTP
jgi:hypothetical protein